VLVRRLDGLHGHTQVAHVVQCVEVTDRCDAVLLEHVGVQLDHVTGLRIEPDNVDATCECLQVGVWASRCPELVHHVEGALVAVEVERLEPRPTPCFEVVDSSVASRLDSGQKVFGKNAGSERRLEAVSECRAHELDFFLTHADHPSVYVLLLIGYKRRIRRSSRTYKGLA